MNTVLSSYLHDFCVIDDYRTTMTALVLLRMQTVKYVKYEWVLGDGSNHNLRLLSIPATSAADSTDDVGFCDEEVLPSYYIAPELFLSVLAVVKMTLQRQYGGCRT